MKGKHRVIVQNNRLHYEFEIKRNITIIQGDSATGKTTLVEMIRQAANLGASSGVIVDCDVPCRTLEGADWKIILQHLSGNIIFIDEENSFIKTEEFASAVKTSNNYFVLITRENLYNLPYSVEEIYGIHSSGKYQNTKKIYQQMYQIYSNYDRLPVYPEKIVTEDTNAGFEFFQALSTEQGIKCESAGGKTRLFEFIKKSDEEKICIVADGAAIGPEMSRIYNQALTRKNIYLFLPESFEWLILNSGVVNSKNIKKILDAPENYVDSVEYFSWEQFFTKLLVDETRDTYLHYNKSKLNQNYLHPANIEKVKKCLDGLSFEHTNML